MAANLLEGNLRQLSDYLINIDSSTKDQASNLVSDISQICLQDITDKDIDYVCSLLFDKEIGILAFLNKTISNEEFQNSKAGALDLLSRFTARVGKKVVVYGVEIKEICLSLFSRDRLAKTKVPALQTLTTLLETIGSQLGDDLKVTKMIEKFFMELTKTSKHTPTVKCNIYILLGVLAQIYPENMTAYSEKLVGLYITALKAEMTSKSKKPELSIITGCLEGLTNYLTNFTQSVDEDSKYTEDIFTYARKAIDPNVNYQRYDAPKAGLKLFSKHASQFNWYLLDDYKSMYEKLRFWSRYHNRDVLHLGVAAMDSYLAQVSEMLVSKAKEGKKEGAIFKFFVKEFRDIMNDNTASSKEVSVAIKGYGQLASPCRMFLSPSDVQFMLSEMITKCEQQFLGQQDDLIEKITSLPSYMEALASIVREVDEVLDVYTATLERLLVLLLENIPNLHSAQHYTALKAILHVLLSMMPKPTSFQQLLSGFVYQSLIRTCSHPVVVETEQSDEPGTQDVDFSIKKVTYRDYMKTWLGLFDSAKIKEFSAEDVSIAERHTLTEALYNELLNSITKVLNKLDLTSNTSSQLADQLTSEAGGDNSGLEDIHSDPVHGIQPNRPRDFQVFINLVDFFKDLFPIKHTELFEKWIFSYTHSMILMSTKNPLVSGFYKLLSVIMKIANSIGFFKDVSVLSPVKQEKTKMKMVGNLEKPSSGQKMACFLLMKKFSKEDHQIYLKLRWKRIIFSYHQVLVRMKQYRDDLLASCLTLVLSLPKEIIILQMTDVVPAVQVTLTIGVSYLPLAMIALDALEYWSSNLPEAEMEKIYPDILPHLDSYLQTMDQGSEEVTLTMKENQASKRKTKLSLKMFKVKKEQVSKSYQSQLTLVKQRIMRYLGSLGGSLNYALLSNTEDDVSSRAIAWDTHKHLKFDMPFVDMKPTIYFDPFLPHIVELASKSSDRQTKVAACELLHSLVLYCIGRGVQQPGAQQEKFPMDRLYRKLFPVILQLACDVEQVSRQLFEPLTMQLIHWFTNNKKAESDETMALLDTIFDGIVQPKDTALRDFCGTCLHEFLSWSIKQTSKKAMEKSPINVKSLLKRIYSFALHPSPFKRLGAALAFNSIYTVLREEDSLVDRFTFELLVHFVESLGIAHADEKSMGTQEQCCKSLDHLERIIKGKAPLLQRESKNRTEPHQWSKVTLDIGVRWLMRQCGRPQTECRHACMKLVFGLAAKVTGIKTTQAYFQAFLKSGGAAYFLERFEGGGHAGRGNIGIAKCPELTDVSDVFSLQAVLSWFDMLLAVLDCYTWVFSENLLTPAAILKGDKKNSSKIFDALVYFIDNIAQNSLEQVSELFTSTTESTFFTPRETEEFSRAKCTVIVRLWNFLSVLFAKHTKDINIVFPTSLYSENLWNLLFMCVIQPSSVGFNMGDVEIMMKLPEEMEQTLQVLMRFLPKTAADGLKNSLKLYLTGDRDLPRMLPIQLIDAGTDHVLLQQMVSGYMQLHSAGLLQNVHKQQKCDVFAADLFNCVYKGIVVEIKKGNQMKSVSLTPSAINTAKKLLDLSFQLGISSEIIIDGLLTTTQVSSISDVEQCHGDLFFSLFKSNISIHFAKVSDKVMLVLSKRAASNSRRIGNILISMIDHLSRDKNIRKKLGISTVSSVLLEWKNFSCWWNNKASLDQLSLIVHLTTKLLLIDSKFATDVKHPAFETMFSMYQSLLTDSRTNLAFKCRVLDLLPFFGRLPDSHSSKLKSSLDRLIADNFPLKSSEFPAGSPKHNDYIAALDKIMNGLVLSGSFMMLEVVISIFCRESHHIHEDEILDAISKFTKRLQLDKQKLALDVPFKIFEKEGSFPAEIRKSTIQQVCIPMLRLVKTSAVIEFFSDHICWIMDVVNAKQTKGSEAVVENQLISKMCCFELLEIMYSSLSVDEVKSKNSVINNKFCKAKSESGSEMTQSISKAAHAAKGEDIRGETSLLELRRQHHCAAYNLLISVISATQTDQKFYVGFLFKEDVAKGQFWLDNLVDKDRVYEFHVELSSPMERKKKFHSIRNEARERERSVEEDEYSVASSYNLASQYLAGSSLSDDLNQYDFTMSGTSQMSRGLSQLRKKTSYSNPDEDPDTQVTMDGDYVELEMDDLNKHECMATMIALLQHMQKRKVTPTVAQGSSPAEMPQWMYSLHRKFSSSSTSNNIKYFIAKLISNTAEIFQPYAKFWLKPMCQLIVTSPIGSSGINYFIVDIVVTMLSWNTTAIPQDTPEEKGVASRLVEYLVANIFHETRQVFKNNLEMLKTLLECWKGRIEIPYQIIYDQLKNADPSSKSSSSGVQVLGVVIACKYPPYGPVAPVDRERFFHAAALPMGSKYKGVYAASAEVVGMILKHLAEKEKLKEGPIHDHFIGLLNSLHMNKTDNFITCVHRMHRHYPEIADRFLSKFLFKLPNLHGEFRTLCLEVIQTRVDKIENAFIELKSKGFVNYLTHRDEGTQLVSLGILKAILPKLEASQLLFLLPFISGFSVNPSAACRNIMYDILMWIYDNYRDDDKDESNKLMQQTKENLLKGLADEDLHCRLQVQNFWSSETRLPVGTLDRLVAMLEAMYSPNTEQQYLSYATNLLLEMTSKSPDYQREIFEHPLSECKFQDISVKSSWRQRHAVMTPLFATQNTQMMDESMSEDSVDGGIRATVDVQQFASTQVTGSKGPFNWLTQSSLDTYSDFNTFSSTADTQSHLLFSVGTGDSQGKPRRKRFKVGPNFGQKKMGENKPSTSTGAPKAEDDVNQSSDILRLKRRFLKDQEATKVYFARRMTRIKRMEQLVAEEQKQRRENQVTMYRKYRTGDLPDIQIKYSYIIAPLQAVAQRNSTVARILFSCIFQAIFARMDEVKTERQMEDIINNINNSMMAIFSSSSQYYPPFLGCIMEILYELRNSIQVNDPSELANCAIVSNLQPLGIVVMEEQLIQQDSVDSRSAKRGKVEGTSISKDVSMWIELARLYKSVDEFDVLRGVFSGIIGTKPITKDAIEAESRGDYQSARGLYEEAMQCDKWSDGKPIEAEIDLWDESRLKCLNNLTQWNFLQTTAVGGVDTEDPPNLQRIWDDTFYQDHYLPFIIRSKLKLMLHGDENQQILLDFVDTSMAIPDQKAFLESRYCEELALMYLWQEEYDRCRYYVKTAVERFQQDWSSTDCLMTSSRTSKLQTLQRLTELQEFLQFIDDQNNFSTSVPATLLVEKWEKRCPHLILDPVSIWDDIVTNRYVYMDHINAKLSDAQNSQDSMEVDNDDMFEEKKVRLKLSMAESCQEQNNFALTLKILKETHQKCKSLNDKALLVEWSHHYSATHHRKVQTAASPWTEEMYSSILTTLDQLGKYTGDGILSEKPALGRRHGVLMAQGFDILVDGILSNERINSLSAKVTQKLLEYGNTKSLKREDLAEKLVEQGYQVLKSAVGFENVSRNENVRFGVEESHLAMAKYCDKFLKMKENDEIVLNTTLEKTFSETVVICMLKAMQLDSIEARQRFPRLLQMVEYYPDTLATFIRKSSEVPCWMFIQWISQMMALMDKNEGPAVQPLLEAIAREFPQAVVYPYRISCEGFSFEDSKQDSKNKLAAERLGDLLNDEKVPLVSKFMSALEQFGQPDMLFKLMTLHWNELIELVPMKGHKLWSERKNGRNLVNLLGDGLTDSKDQSHQSQELQDWYDDMKKLLQQSKKTKSEILEKFQDMYCMLFDYKVISGGASATQMSSSSVSMVEMGDYRRKFAENFKRDVEGSFGKDGQKLVNMSPKDFMITIKKLMDKINPQVKGTLKPPSSLKEYCNWLSDFNPNKDGRDLEIPGQYDGLSKPLPEYHVKIAGFDQRVLVMSSLRKPKRITIRGNDAKEYRYLVKGGEDSRQDQRIESLFTLMNKVFEKDTACRSRKLKLRTYQVIPMTTRVGLIEWMNNTQPLKDFLYEAFTEQERKFFLSEQGPQQQHMKWTNKFQSRKGFGDMYGQVYLKYSKTDTIREFRMKESKVPWELSRRAFHQMSTSPEAFHVLRSTCAVTHSLISICQWLLGIGDRHLSNFMINLKTGEMVGIDFGHAFGSAAQFLPVPELMPFRLTRQLLNLMLPLQVKGMMESTMIHVLRALHNNCDLILSTMDVFIKEPSLDWKQNAEKQANEGMETEDADIDDEWYPKQKIRFAKRKLKGDNPCYITRDELKMGHSSNPAFRAYEKVVLGDNTDNTRAQLPDKGLSVEQQVASLIDQATDPNLLGRVYVGWEPWM